MKRFIADFLLCLLFIAIIGLFGCSAPQPLGPNLNDQTWTDGTVDSTWTCQTDPRCTPNLPPIVE